MTRGSACPGAGSLGAEKSRSPSTLGTGQGCSVLEIIRAVETSREDGESRHCFRVGQGDPQPWWRTLLRAQRLYSGKRPVPSPNRGDRLELVAAVRAPA